MRCFFTNMSYISFSLILFVCSNGSIILKAQKITLNQITLWLNFMSNYAYNCNFYYSAAKCQGTPVAQTSSESLQRTQILILAVVCAVFAAIIIVGIVYMVKTRWVKISTVKNTVFYFVFRYYKILNVFFAKMSLLCSAHTLKILYTKKKKQQQKSLFQVHVCHCERFLKEQLHVLEM